MRVWSVKVKVKFILGQVMKSSRWGLLSVRLWWVVSATLRALYPWERDRVPILQVVDTPQGRTIRVGEMRPYRVSISGPSSL
jgi:hypothetical protein